MGARGRIGWIAALSGVGVALAMAGATPTGAATLAEERRALARARSEADAARRRGETLERRAAGAGREADRARDQAAAMAARVQQAEADLRAGEARLAIVGRLQRAQSQRLAARRQPIARLVAALQALARRPAALALLRPGSMTDAVHVRMVLAAALPEIERRTQGLRADLARSRAIRADAELARAALARSRSALSARRASLAALEARKRVASQRLRDTAAIESDRALAIGEDARDIVDLMARMEDASSMGARLAALPGPTLRPARPGAALAPRPGQDEARTARAPAYRIPVVGDIVAGFGEVSRGGVRSRGLTLAAAPGAAVVAPANGRIVFAGPFRTYGSIVIIDHGGGWTSLLTRMRRLSVMVGDPVRQGDPIGAADLRDPRVTIEVRRGDRPVDIGALLR